MEPGPAANRPSSRIARVCSSNNSKPMQFLLVSRRRPGRPCLVFRFEEITGSLDGSIAPSNLLRFALASGSDLSNWPCARGLAQSPRCLLVPAIFASKGDSSTVTRLSSRHRAAKGRARDDLGGLGPSRSFISNGLLAENPPNAGTKKQVALVNASIVAEALPTSGRNRRGIIC